jgi:hypothetical protein
MPLIDPLALLERQDKWYLGNAGLLLYAPPFPKHLATPGFFDECHFGDLALPRLLAVGFAADAGGGLAELTPRLISWRWRPDRLDAGYALCWRRGVAEAVPSGVRLTETRRVGPDGTLHCDLELSADEGSPLTQVHAVAWTGRQTRVDDPEGWCENFSDLESYGRSITYRYHAARRAHGRGDSTLPLAVTLDADRVPASLRVICSHGAEITPRLDCTALWDELKSEGRLSGKVEGKNPLGSVVYAGLHWLAKLAPGKPWHTDVRVRVVLDPRGSKAAHSLAATTHALDTAPAPGRGRHSSAATPDPLAAWREFLTLVPHFECNDARLTRYYWYRWYGLRLNAVPPGGNYCAPGVTEGIAYFRGVITYSLMCHLYECKWLADPALAQGCLRNHIKHQTLAGHFAGHIYVSHANAQGFYHTDVGRSVGELLAHHPAASFAQEAEQALARLLGFYDRERDPEGSGLYDVRDQYETGQEFTSRYFHADERADLYGWEHKLRLKGVDVTCYVYHLARLLERLALERGDARAVRKYAKLAERTRIAVNEFMWDAARGFWFDYSAPKQARSPYWTAVGCYPILSDLASREQALAAGAHFLNPFKFDTHWPTPTVAADDPHFSADPRWRGERANCPWNGRVWPMVNSHVTEVLAALAEHDPAYRARTAAYLRRFIALLHFETGGMKDSTRPNCFEHYSPADGTACEYRGIDDYQHSWVADLILKYVAGVRLSGCQLVIDPLPFGLDWFLLKDCHLAGCKLDVCWNRDRRGQAADGLRVYIDGRLVFRSNNLVRWEVQV